MCCGQLSCLHTKKVANCGEIYLKGKRTLFNLFGIVNFGLNLLLGIAGGGLLSAADGKTMVVGFDPEHLEGEGYKNIATIMRFLNEYLIPITIGLLALAVILAIVLGVQLGKAEDAKAASDAKKRLIGIFIAFVTFLVALWIGAVIMNNIPEIVKTLRETFKLGEGWQDVKKDTTTIIKLLRLGLK